MVSVGVALVLILVKFIAYIFTDSVALLSSLVDSVLDSLASLVNLVAVRHALEPADEEHRFGHGKAEPLAGLAQAAFIAGSSLFLVFESINRLVHPQMVQHTLARNPGYAFLIDGYPGPGRISTSCDQTDRVPWPFRPMPCTTSVTSLLIWVLSWRS